MTVPLELEVQRAIEDALCELGLYPDDVVYVNTGDLKFLKISFIMKQELPEFLDYLDYKDLADKSGIIVYEQTLTVILRGITLRYFIEKLG